MDNTDANSIGMLNGASQPRLQVIKVYPLDGMTVSKSRLWISVIQCKHEAFKRLFLRDGHEHRRISVQSALRLLPGKAGKELSSLLKVSSKKGGGSKAIPYGIITPLVPSKEQNKYSADKNEISKHVDKPYMRDESQIKLTSDSQASISAAVDAAQLKGWGAIDVAGSDRLRKQLWMEAASRGMYVEGYMHTEEDRQSLMILTPESNRHLIKPEYKPVTLAYVKKNISRTLTVANPLAIANKKTQAITDTPVAKSTDDLTEDELTYLLMRVQQIEHSKAEVALANQTHYSAHYMDANTDDSAQLI